MRVVWTTQSGYSCLSAVSEDGGPLALLSTRIVEGERIAIQAPSKEFGERVKADKALTKQYVDLSNRVTDFFTTTLPETPLVITDNVTEYLFSNETAGSNASWSVGDLPTVTPPFKSVFLETASPNDAAPIRSWGAFFSRLDEPESCGNPEIPDDMVRWVVEMALLFDDRGIIKTHPAVYLFYLDATGQLLCDSQGSTLYETATIVEPELAGILEGDSRWEELKESTFSLALPFWFAFAFMHCKNVTLESPPVSRQVRRQAERKGTPLLDYRVLNIEPMKRVLKTEGRLDDAGPKVALHICRGHFKDFRDGPGLFGKHKGVYWWEGSVRGLCRGGRLRRTTRSVHLPELRATRQ
jgi:hypothetical protein